MPWKLFFITFGSIFVAELADKTQIVGLGLSARTMRPGTVLVASVLAYTVVTTISVFIGASFGKFLRPDIIKYVGGTLFILIGLLMFAGKV